jgi:hypothetical protein
VEFGENFRCPANYRGGSNISSLSVNKKTGLWIDFGNGLKGNMHKLAELT